VLKNDVIVDGKFVIRNIGQELLETYDPDSDLVNVSNVKNEAKFNSK
jgi:hypothetical protein